ncbi:MAG: NAD(P)/FAD-dependent oxidoreductase [Hyphomicrobiales bacterium]|nr:NAD(P)/FAD-dependent oxidoreductase [Hyphomicrobiales bacterium]MDE2114792.1 NAD(P)/FAD-dependent oxidoreductase [Hyphomicrobiales bacterium]
MNAQKNYDLIVVGLGPAGASAAQAAAKAGLRVLALDRKRTAGLPVQCAEFVPGPMSGHVSNLNAAIRQPIHAMVTRVERDLPHHTDDFRGAMIDRAQFDQNLVDEAAKAGVEIRFGQLVKAVTAQGLVLQDGTLLNAPVLIGADGPHSALGKAIGAINHECVETRQITVALLQSHEATDIFLSPDYRGGYAWLFPKGDVAHIGLGVEPGLRHRLKPLLAVLHADMVAQGRVGAEILRHTGGAIPVGGLIRCIGEIAGHKVLLAGDAAGLTNPVTGAGIASAVQSGRMAGEAAAQFVRGKRGALDDYAEEIDDVFGPSLKRAVFRRARLMRESSSLQPPNNAQLRESWIAFPQYWEAMTDNAANLNESIGQ